MQGVFPVLREAGAKVGRELGGQGAGTSQGCLCQAGGSCCLDGHSRDAVAAPAPPAPTAVQSSTGERLEGLKGRVLQHRGSALARDKVLPQGPGWHKAASAAGRGQLLAGCTLSGSSNLL